MDDPLWRHVGDWPQVPGYLRQTLDANLIPEQATAVLWRSLDVQRVVAFVGSGVSMSYGRLGWGESITWMATNASNPPAWEFAGRKPIDALRDRTRPGQPAPRDKTRTQQRMRALLEELRDPNANVGIDLQSGSFPAMFQFLEQCALEMHEPSQEQQPRRESRVRRGLRALLSDDAGQAYMLFERLLEDCWRLHNAAGAYDDLWPAEGTPAPAVARLVEHWLDLHEIVEKRIDADDDARREPEYPVPRAPWRRPFTVDAERLQSLGTALTHLPGAPELCADLLRALFGVPGVTRSQLAPLHRFVVTALARLDPAVACAVLWRDDAGPRPASGDAPARRAEFVAEGRDPLLMLLRDFGIVRFATTNYDEDIERAIADLGYDGGGEERPQRRRATDAGRGLSRNALGMTAHDTVFRHLHAVELLRFAAARSSAIQVVHLHGRVRPCEPLVVTEGDYQSLYLQRTEIADAANDAIGLALRTNTMLFVGSGMSEDDILRPMRQFVTERKSFADRSGVVLLPAHASRSRQIQEVIALYGRYGVLTKHFGVGDPVADLPAGLSDDRRGAVRWLERWLQVRSHLDGQLEGWQEAIGQLEEAALKERLIAARDRFMAPMPGWPGQAGSVPVAINGVPLEVLLPLLGLGRSFDDLTEIAILKSVARAMVRLLRSLTAEEMTLETSEWLSELGVDNRAAVAGTGPMPLISTREAYRLMAALRALLHGLDGSLRALAMVLELGSLHRGWLTWKQDRTVAPTARPVGAQRHDVKGEAAQAVHHVFTRNRLALRRLSAGTSPGAALWTAPRWGEVPDTDRFMEGAPSHSFACFEDALRTLVPPMAVGPGRACGPRRMFLLIARRGLGKGHFFEMMGEAERVCQFVRASWHRSPGGSPWRSTPPSYAVACYVNLGVSLEFLSAFDRLSLVLVEMSERVFEDSRNVRDAIHEAARELEHNRLARLRTILRLYARHAAHAQERVLIAFNGFGQFFDWNGVPKNAQLHRLIEALIGDAAAEVPIDVLMICQASDLPGRFTVRGQQLPIRRNADLDRWSGLAAGPMAQLFDTRAGERQLRKAHQLRDRLALAVADEPPQGNALWVHVLRGAHASATIGKYFPEVALALALNAAEFVGRLQCTPAEVREVQNQTMQAVTKHEAALDRKGHPVAIQELTLGLLSELAVEACRAPATEAGVPLRLLVDRQPIPERVRKLLEPSNDSAAAARAPTERLDERFRSLHHAVRENRFLLTIVCAAASERGWRRTFDLEPGWSFDPAEATGWLDGVALDVSNHLQDDAVDRIIGKVLASHHQRHDRGELPPAWVVEEPLPCRSDGRFEPLRDSLKKLADKLGVADVQYGTLAKDLELAMCGPAAWRLQQRLLWHLAVMALEVQADVLATAPLVEADCIRLVAEVIGRDGRPLPLDEMRSSQVCRLLVEAMLDLLVHRCLVFRMEPVRVDNKPLFSCSDEPRAPKEARGAAGEGAPVHSGWRFAIHRFLQRAILEHMQAPYVEFPRVDQFGLSLWATQPDELPRPNRSTAHDIAGLVSAWIGFPKNPAALKATSTFHWFLDDARNAGRSLVQSEVTAQDQQAWLRATLPARMLRAALGVLRATYSVGVVSRFHDFDDDGAGHTEPDEGYFKQHHLQVRWLIEQAKRLRSDVVGLGGLVTYFEPEQVSPVHPQADLVRGAVFEAVSPFYVDEIVWLNNECGLFCLVEGRLDNAAGMFRQALIAAERVEGRDLHGALWCRIHLNLAIVDIERGRIRQADERLAAIEAVPDENPILRILARGFRALVDHLSGNLDRAASVYAAVLEDLVALRQLRAVAIFSRHLAELHRMQGAAAAVPALRAIEQSIAAATKGGHEDIRHLAMLSRIRLAIAGVLPAEELRRQLASMQPELDAIEHYGQVMGMPRLLSDVAYARALHLLNQGGTRQAAHLAYRCLALCGTNGLRLRQMMCMALLGRIYEARGLAPLADSLLKHAYALALECHYGNLREAGRSIGVPSAAGR